jgi:hypothetical protein
MSQADGDDGNRPLFDNPDKPPLRRRQRAALRR